MTLDWCTYVTVFVVSAAPGIYYATSAICTLYIDYQDHYTVHRNHRLTLTEPQKEMPSMHSTHASHIQCTHGHNSPSCGFIVIVLFIIAIRIRYDKTFYLLSRAFLPAFHVLDFHLRSSSKYLHQSLTVSFDPCWIYVYRVKVFKHCSIPYVLSLKSICNTNVDIFFRIWLAKHALENHLLVHLLICIKQEEG